MNSNYRGQTLSFASTIDQFILYFICGFYETWLIFFMWGFSNGPANGIPYFAAVGSVLLLIVPAPLVLFVPRIAAAVAVAIVGVALPWPALILIHEHSLPGFVISGIAPSVAGAAAVWHLWTTRGGNWLALCTSPGFAVHVLLAPLPLLVFVFALNARLIVILLLEGPPR
jgi:hypothetical protein